MIVMIMMIEKIFKMYSHTDNYLCFGFSANTSPDFSMSYEETYGKTI